MSNTSVTSNNSQKNVTELTEELEGIRAMNTSLRAYLEHLRSFKRNLAAMDNNFKQLSKVNSKWFDVLTRK